MPPFRAIALYPTSVLLHAVQVPSTIAAMHAHAKELQRNVASLDSMLSNHNDILSGPMAATARRGADAVASAAAAALDRGYIAAQRCSIWRSRVQVCRVTPLDSHALSPVESTKLFFLITTPAGAGSIKGGVE